MHDFTVNTLATNLLESTPLREHLEDICVHPDLAEQGDIIALALSMRTGGRQVETFDGVSKLAIRQFNNRAWIAPWHTHANTPRVSSKIPMIAQAFTHFVTARNFDLIKAIRKMHTLTGRSESTYSVILGKTGGYVRRMNATIEEGLMTPQVHRTDEDIQRFIDGQCLALVPAHGSAHVQLQAAKIGTQIGRECFEIRHPITDAILKPRPMPAMAQIFV